MVSRRFSVQKGAQRQKSLKQFKAAMAACGEDLVGILNTGMARSLRLSCLDLIMSPQPKSLSKYWAKCLSSHHGQQGYNGLLLYSRVALRGQPW